MQRAAHRKTRTDGLPPFPGWANHNPRSEATQRGWAARNVELDLLRCTAGLVLGGLACDSSQVVLPLVAELQLPQALGARGADRSADRAGGLAGGRAGQAEAAALGDR